VTHALLGYKVTHGEPGRAGTPPAGLAGLYGDNLEMTTGT